MIKLQRGTLTPLARFTPESMSLTLTERDSSATLSLGPDAPDIAVGDWLMDDTEPGKGIVWRVKSLNENFDTRTRSIQTEHIIQTLKDLILFGEVTGGMMGGSDENCPAQSAVQYVMRQQSIWKLGSFEYAGVSAGYSFNGDTLYSALETICTTLEGCWWDYDLSRIPFTLHIRHAGSAVMSEMRAGRNISTLRRSIDRSRMYTRIYPVGENNLHISGDYIEKNIGIYGIVSKTETDQSIGSEDMLRRWAQDRLNRHCEPTVTIEITGLELCRSTGESLDRLIIGTRCRAPLPEYGTIITERITKLSWRDKIREPESVIATLANNEEDLARIISQEVTGSASTAARGGRAGAKKAEEDHAWFVDTTDHVAMVAEAVAGPGAAENWSRVAEIVVDGKGIHQRVTEAEGDIVTHQAAIEVNERAIQQEVIDRSNQGTELSGKISVQADRIDQEVQVRKDEDTKLDARITTEATQIKSQVSNMDSRLSGQIAVTDRTASMSVGRVKYSAVRHYSNRSSFPATGTAGVLYYADDTGKAYLYLPGTHSYELAAVDEYGNANYIKAGEIAISINESGNTEAKLDADVIYAGKNTKQTLAGLELPDWMNTTEGLVAEKATIVDLKAVHARVETLEADTITTKTLSASIAALSVVNANGLNATNNVVAGGYAMAPIYYIGSPGNAKSFSSVLTDASVSGNTLTITKVDGTTLNFSKATTLRGEWGSDKFAVTASPQNVSYDVKVIIDQNFTPSGQSSAIKVVKPSARGVNWLRVQQQVGDLSSGSRTIKTIVGSTTVEETTITDYNDGFNAVSKPSVTYTDLGDTTLGNVSGTASISNKTDETTRSTSISLSLDKTTYTPSQAVGAKNCVVVKTSGNVVVGRIDTQSVYDGGHSDGYTEGHNDGYTAGGSTAKVNTVYKIDALPEGKSAIGLSAADSYYQITPAYVNKSGVSVATENITYIKTPAASTEVTVDNWQRSNFGQDTKKRASKTLSIPVSVNVNGVSYSHTFTTGSMSLEKYDSTYVNVYMGSTIIARLAVFDD